MRTWVVRAPGTHVYLFALLVTTQTVHSLHPTLATELLRNTSTNLFQMGRNAGRVLFLSAFILRGGRWITQVVMFSAVYVPLERWAGSWRWLGVVTAGHVGATLVTTVGIWADVRFNAGATQLVRTIDVGVSYGFFAAAGLLTFGLGRRWMRVGMRVGLVAGLTVPLMVTHTFSDLGHMSALCIGASLYGIFEPGLRWRRKLLAPRSSSGSSPTVGAARTALSP